MRPECPTVCVVGLGYIGLPTAALIASRGLNVIGVDVDLQVVATVGAGRVHIIEADLELLVQKSVRSGRLIASTRPQPADVFLIAVPTPLSQDKKPVLDYVFAATRSIAPKLKRGDLDLKSTSPVGTTEAIAGILAGMRPDLTFPNGPSAAEADIALAYCPERVLPGRILKELVENDRCVGGLTSACAAKAKRFYQHFVRGECIETGDAHRRNGEAHRKRLSRHQYCVCQRTVDGVRPAGHRCLGVDRAREPTSACGHSQTRTWCGRPLHRRRSLVHYRRHSTGGQADPFRP